MKLTTEQIERVLNEAPEGATHCDKDGKIIYKHQRPYWLRASENGGWRNIGLSFDCRDSIPIDSLREILELRKEVERLRGKLGEVSKVLGCAHSAAEWPTSYCISEIEDSLNIDGFLKGEVK